MIEHSFYERTGCGFEPHYSNLKLTYSDFKLQISLIQRQRVCWRSGIFWVKSRCNTVACILALVNLAKFILFNKTLLEAWLSYFLHHWEQRSSRGNHIILWYPTAKLTRSFTAHWTTWFRKTANVLLCSPLVKIVMRKLEKFDFLLLIV